MTRLLLPVLAVLLAAGCAAGTAPAPAPDADWVTYNGPLAGDRYSPLAGITPANVAQLRQRCAFDVPASVSFQTGIVAVGGVLYFTAYSDTYAIDAVTCAQRWMHSRPEPRSSLAVNRGVAFSNGTVFRGTGDAHVVAIEAASGRQLWDVSIGDAAKGESVPMAPIAWNGLVFAGNAGGDTFGVTGRIYGLDAASGRTVWRFDVVPESGPARDTWLAASPENPPTGGATWTSYALDEANGILYVSTGNPAPDFMEALHPGDNLYANSLLALDAKTGRLLSYVQPIRNDFHDWDLSAPPALLTTKSGRPIVAAGGKDGYVYLIDRAAGSLTVRNKALTTTMENETAPLSAERFTRFCPGTQGGIEWNGPTYHPALGLLFVNSIDWCAAVKLLPVEQMKGVPGRPWTGMNEDGMFFGRADPFDRARGWVTAVDAETGAVRWKVQTPKPMVGAITATAGGLVFTGDLDGNVLAYDAASGKELWRDATGKAIGGGVISYGVAGRQYVAAAAGLNSRIWPVTGGPARVVVYALP